LSETLDLNGLYELHPEVKAAFKDEEAERFGSGASDYAEQYFAARSAAEARRSDGDYGPLSSESVASSACDVKAVAFYLPQFHPIDENDAAWGKGFTEWTNVSKAVPEFLGHYQPHLPGELGFYDLRIPAVMARQAALAKQHGLHGFCFHHYWFGGKRVLEKPVRQFLADRSIDIPFCLCWANENWSRRWDGSEHDIIIAQSHSPEDDLAFIADLIPALRDPRYIRIEGKPMLLVYRPAILPNARATTELWRSYCRSQGLGEIFLVCAQTFHFADPPATIGFDASVEFPPHSLSVPDIAPSLRLLNPRFRGLIADYRELVSRARETPPADYPRFPAVFPSWDNSPRRPARGTIFAHASPAQYRDWLDASFQRARRDLPPGQRFVFINAWNEWGEGAHLEPDRRYGYAWLNATAAVVRDHSERSDAAAQSPRAAARSA
jgi:lipopolysaccharide biosynthesis protein